LIAFKREQQADIDTWLKVMPAVTQKHAGLHYYELPTIQKSNVMVRWFIDNGMRGGIPDQQQRARTITLYIDKAPFKKSLGIQSEDSVYAMLIDKAGKVLWRADGRYTDAAGQQLEAALAK
jgi:predicted transcriptional regulator